MADRTREASKEPRSTTVLDPLRPAVVVRRRVYDATAEERGAESPRAFSSTAQPPSFVATDDDESGPPSSINVARAVASLRGDELQRVEELLRADEEEEETQEVEERAESVVEAAPPPPPPAFEPAPATPAKPTLTLGKTIALSELARRMGVSAQELPVTLVARGFYALDATTVLPRQTARVIAEMYGWQVEDAPPEVDASAPVRSGTRSRIARKRSVRTKAKPKSKVKVKAKTSRSKPAKRRLAR